MTPAVRRLLREHGLTAAQIVGTGGGGRITREDVDELVESQRTGQPVGGQAVATRRAPRRAATPAAPAAAAPRRSAPAAPAPAPRSGRRPHRDPDAGRRSSSPTAPTKSSCR